MADTAFGTEAELRIYRALSRTGRKEPADFVFTPGDGVSFIVSAPLVGLRIVSAFGESGAEALLDASAGFDVRLIDESDALSRPERALSEALGG